jgi:hypothetical protein
VKSGREAMKQREQDMKRPEETVRADRRSFLKLAGAGVVSGGAVAAAAAPAAAEEDKGKPSLYRETDHVKRYYELARF